MKVTACAAAGTAGPRRSLRRFFGSLKKDRTKTLIYKTRELARADVLDYIEVFHNRQRRHSHLGDVSPEAFGQASFWGLVVLVIPGALHFLKMNGPKKVGRPGLTGFFKCI